MKRWRFLLIIIPFVILFAVSAIVMWLWNWLLPDIFGIKSISFWQAMGILVISKILFGGFRGKRDGWNKLKEMRGGRNFENLQNLSDEEKERLKNLWKERCKARFCNSDRVDEKKF